MFIVAVGKEWGEMSCVAAQKKAQDVQRAQGKRRTRVNPQFPDISIIGTSEKEEEDDLTNSSMSAPHVLNPIILQSYTYSIISAVSAYVPTLHTHVHIGSTYKVKSAFSSCERIRLFLDCSIKNVVCVLKLLLRTDAPSTCPSPRSTSLLASFISSSNGKVVLPSSEIKGASSTPFSSSPPLKAPDVPSLMLDLDAHSTASSLSLSSLCPESVYTLLSSFTDPAPDVPSLMLDLDAHSTASSLSLSSLCPESVYTLLSSFTDPVHCIGLHIEWMRTHLEIILSHVEHMQPLETPKRHELTSIVFSACQMITLSSLSMLLSPPNLSTSVFPLFFRVVSGMFSFMCQVVFKFNCPRIESCLLQKCLKNVCSCIALVLISSDGDEFGRTGIESVSECLSKLIHDHDITNVLCHERINSEKEKRLKRKEEKEEEKEMYTKDEEKEAQIEDGLPLLVKKISKMRDLIDISPILFADSCFSKEIFPLHSTGTISLLGTIEIVINLCIIECFIYRFIHTKNRSVRKAVVDVLSDLIKKANSSDIFSSASASVSRKSVYDSLFLSQEAASQMEKSPYPVGHPDLSEIDGSKAYGDYYSGDNHSSLLGLLRGERAILFIRFNPNLHLPFISPHYLSKFVVSHHSYPDGIKDFNAAFTTSDGKMITKEYQMGEMPPEHYFWQEFPIDIDNVISCDIHVISSWDGKQKGINLFGIRFVTDKEQEAKKEKERKEQIERERKERVIIEQQEQAKQRIELMRLDGELKREKELKERAEMKDLMSDFISSTQQRFEELEKKLSDEKEQRVHDKEDFKRIRASDVEKFESKIAQFEKELQSKQSHDDEERCPRHLLSKRAVVASLQSILSQVEQRPESEQFHFSVELEA
ncbi:hypothetical protein ADUPG1_011325, partial [Aduncisulcus paluster]